MGFLKLFKKKEKDIKVSAQRQDPKPNNPEVLKLLDLQKYMSELLSANLYISKNEYRDKLLNEKKTVEYFAVLDKSGMLHTFCNNNGISITDVEGTLTCYRNFESLIDSHNNDYVSRAMKDEKTYLDNILYDVDPQIKLDDDQRRVILTDEDYCLVIAGAGAGKTTTVAAKVKYLVEKKNINPAQILVVSFTNKAVQELKDKLNKDLKIECPIATFHEAYTFCILAVAEIH